MMNIKGSKDELIYGNKIEDPDLTKVVFYSNKPYKKNFLFFT